MAKLGCQYTVELTVDGYTDGAFLDHDMMEVAIQAAINRMLETSGFAGYTTKVGSVCFETDYPILPPEEL